MIKLVLIAKLFVFNINLDIDQQVIVELTSCKPENTGFETKKSTKKESLADESIMFSDTLDSINLYFLKIYDVNENLIFNSLPFLLSEGKQECSISKTSSPLLLIQNNEMFVVNKSRFFSEFQKLHLNQLKLETFKDSVLTLDSSPQKDSLVILVENITINYKTQSFDLLFSLFSEDQLNNHKFPLWILFFELYKNGYQDYMKYWLKSLNPEIQNYEEGIRCREILFSSDKLKILNSFPRLNLINLKTGNFHQISFSSKYTLIDFWFSQCGKCLVEFEEFEKFYEKNDRITFDVITIAVDRSSSLNFLEKIRLKYQFKWNEYLDENGVNSAVLGIHYFPRNFIVDHKGKILAKDLSINDIELLIQKDGE